MSWELEQVLKKIRGEFVCSLSGKSQVFASVEAFEQSSFGKNCAITAISARDGRVVLELEPWKPPTADTDSEWASEQEQSSGTGPSFF